MHDGGANTSNKFIRDYKARLAQVDLTQIYSVLNALQDTPFIVNRDMLAIIHAIMDTGGGLGLPRLEPEAKLPDLPEPYTEEELVSSDIIGLSEGSLFDATQTRVMTVGDKQLVKTVAWYDNEMSYTNQLIRTLTYFASLIK